MPVARRPAELGEQSLRKRIAHHLPLGVPLHCQRKTWTGLHPERLHQSVGGARFDRQIGCEPVDSLPVQRVHPHPIRSGNLPQQRSGLQHHVMGRAVLHLERLLLVLAMIVQPLDLVHALMQRAAHRDVHLLEPAAHAKYRHSARHRTRDQRQRGRVAMWIMQCSFDARGSRVPGGLHVRRAAREENTVDAREDFRDVQRRLEHGDQQRQTIGGLDHSRNVLLADRVKRMRADHASIGGNANHGSS
jgi:hypothetical protein